jgi:hypothetical protein
MAFEYAAMAIGTALIAVVLIWSSVRVGSRLRAIDSQLAKMQKEIDILHMHESRRLMMELKANSKVDAPKIDPDNDRIEIDGGDVVRLTKTPPTTPA